MTPQTKIDAKRAEEYVRARWEDVTTRWLPSMPDRFRIEMVYDSAMVWTERPKVKLLSEKPFVRKQTEASAWLLAYEFTLKREEEIRLKQEEIEWLKRSHEAAKRFAELEEISCITGRILAVLEAQLAELTRGMKAVKDKAE